MQRPIERIIESVRTLEGGGFPVRRPFPTPQVDHVDPFLLLDHFGPVEWGPGEAIGAPDHPHRGFETVSYILAGQMEHKDSFGHAGSLGPGDVQWMTAGGGLVHSEMPAADFKARGGVMEGFQIWVNLPRSHKRIEPRYQEVPRDEIPTGRSDDGKVSVKVVAGEALGARAVIDTITPIMYLHFTVDPGGEATPAVPPDHNAMIYVFSGAAGLGPAGREVREGQLAVFGAGETIAIRALPAATEPAQLLLLSGVPLAEPVARYGPFVMNTKDEIVQAFQDFQAGKMGEIT